MSDSPDQFPELLKWIRDAASNASTAGLETSDDPERHRDLQWDANRAVAMAAYSIAWDVRRIRELLEAHLKPTEES